VTPAPGSAADDVYGLHIDAAEAPSEPARPFGLDRYRGSFCLDELGAAMRYEPPYLIGY